VNKTTELLLFSEIFHGSPPKLPWKSLRDLWSQRLRLDERFQEGREQDGVEFGAEDAQVGFVLKAKGEQRGEQKLF
jgi:hypothetical protein